MIHFRIPYQSPVKPIEMNETELAKLAEMQKYIAILQAQNAFLRHRNAALTELLVFLDHADDVDKLVNFSHSSHSSHSCYSDLNDTNALRIVKHEAANSFLP